MLLTRPFVLGIALLVSNSVAGGQTLLKDFNTTPAGVPSSSPARFHELASGETLFLASTPALGAELWRTDGSPTGTVLVKDIAPGFHSSTPAQFVTLPNGDVLFTASTPSTGNELWKTDGTTNGTTLVVDLLPGSTGSNIVDMTLVGSQVFFFARDGIHGTELFKSDGTAAGTGVVLDIVPGNGGISNGTNKLAAIGSNEVLFSARPVLTWEIWKSDGTAAGTTFVQTLPGGTNASPRVMAEFGPQVIFEADSPTNFGFEAWISDGTTAGTFALGVESRLGFQVAGSLAFFTGFGPDGRELWKTDGTLAGTQQVIDLAPPGPNASSNPAFVGAIGGGIVFSASSGTLERNLYFSDGTAAGTTLIDLVGTPSHFFADNSDTIGGELYFWGVDNLAMSGVWRTDGTAAGTQFVAAQPDGFRSFAATTLGIVFNGEDAIRGTELWRTAGTPATTQLLVDISPVPTTEDGHPYIAGRHLGKAIVVADDGISGREVWATDGTPAGTLRLTDIGPGPASISNFTALASNDRFLIFTANSSAFGNDPWISDGTPAGTQQLPLDAVFPGFAGSIFTPFKDAMIFSGFTNATGNELWITDGTVAGTGMIRDLEPGTANSGPKDFVVWGDRVLFRAETSQFGGEPWITDGTTAGTFQLADARPGPTGTSGIEFFPFGNHAYFGIDDGTSGYELWRTDGTPLGTSLFLDIEAGPASSAPREFQVVGGRLLFRASVAGTVRLFASDGTAPGTLMLNDPPRADFLGRLDDDTALVARFVSSSWELWTTDGTPIGSSLLGTTQFTSANFSTTANLTDDQLQITWYEPVRGSELYTFDGTTPFGRRLFDLAPLNGSPRDMTRIGDRVVFTGTDGIHGHELFVFPIGLIGDEVVEARGHGCPGTAGIVPTLGVEGEADASSPLPFELVVEDALSSTPVILAWSRNLGVAPFVDCILWTAGNVFFEFGATDPSGRAGFSFLPNPSLAGQRFVAQAFPVDPAGTALGIASSTAALELIVGP